MVILDTNILIEHLRLKGNDLSWFEELLEVHPATSLGLSMISIQELYEGKSAGTQAGSSDLRALLSPLRIFDYSYALAQRAGAIARESRTPIVFADAAIAATALEHDLPLATLNTKHFAHIPQLTLVKKTI